MVILVFFPLVTALSASSNDSMDETLVQSKSHSLFVFSSILGKESVVRCSDPVIDIGGDTGCRLYYDLCQSE